MAVRSAQTAGVQRIALDGRDVAYTLMRRPRKTIGLAIDHRGLRVSAPLRASLGEVEALLAQHSGWVLKKLEVWRSAANTQALTINTGTLLPWLGGEVQLILASGRNQFFWSGDGQSLTLALASGRSPAVLLVRALKERAGDLLYARLAHYAKQMGVPVPNLALSSARTRWGSCSCRGTIRLNWRLGHFPLPVIDYVVVHELAHLKEMNHSPRFWAVVEQLCPEWRQRRLELRQLARQMPVLRA
ncbi:MAG: WLM domain protein [Betaproteobacteria bacterium ADurb.Bin341]|nr:MAG: WLM domain protein [Betaproteobacteria bacterium ADurb.Bin341]